MFGLFKKTPETLHAKALGKVEHALNDFERDMRILWKGQDPEARFPETFTVIREMQSLIADNQSNTHSELPVK